MRVNELEVNTILLEKIKLRSRLKKVSPNVDLWKANDIREMEKIAEINYYIGKAIALLDEYERNDK